jgi:hypothetical protein
MTTKKEIVLLHLKGRAKTPICFEDVPIEFLHTFTDDINSNVYSLLYLSRSYATTSLSGRKQCRYGARRSAQDLWRLYKYYVDPEIEIFPIMKAIHSLVYDLKKISGQYCNVVRKTVFWTSSYGLFLNRQDSGDLGIVFEEWDSLEKES